MRPRSYVIAAAGIGSLTLTLTVTPTRTVIAQSMKPLLTEIVNTTTNPVPVRDVDNGRQPFHETSSLTVPNGFGGLVEVAFTVPTGKRLVIESVTARVQIASGDSLRQVNFSTSLEGMGLVVLEVEVSRLGVSPDGSVFTGTHAISAYADPGTDVHVQVQRTDLTDAAHATFTFVGYFVDVP